MTAPCHHRTTCRLCGGAALSKVLSLAATPPANAFVADDGVDQERFPLDVYFCEDCAHVQLLDVVDASVLFSDYVYVSGTSPVFVKHFGDYARAMIESYGLQEGDLVVEIGSNDGPSCGSSRTPAFQFSASIPPATSHGRPPSRASRPAMRSSPGPG